MAVNIKPVKYILYPILEYSECLLHEEFKSQNNQMMPTWFLLECFIRVIATYMFLITDAINISAIKKEVHNLNYSFKSVPVKEIAKLDVYSNGIFNISARLITLFL
jgi:hypothetical protein